LHPRLYLYILFYNPVAVTVFQQPEVRIMVDAVEEMIRQEIIKMINTVNETTRYKK
jgi:endonuclease V-like protein UPF0215 family